ncbi:hypothetical protein BS47DRAFT_1300987, partial [Hydnum rufescens UP504]
FVCSMWTSGEKQFYVFALLETILKLYQVTWRIGPCMNIGCQMTRLEKVEVHAGMAAFALEWGVSNFPCIWFHHGMQLWYILRQIRVWGLSDGEGVSSLE